MERHFKLGAEKIEVVLKNIKSIRLSVHPPLGHIKVSAPRKINLDALRAYIFSKISWIRKHQKKFKARTGEREDEASETGKCLVWGKSYSLSVIERKGTPCVKLCDDQVTLFVRPLSPKAKQNKILAAWYKKQLEDALPAMIAKWEPVLGVKVQQFSVRHMRTRWGSCSPTSRQIRLNATLVKTSEECMEYVVVHEMMHILEPSHNARFKSLMSHYMPEWKALRQKLNHRSIRSLR